MQKVINVHIGEIKVAQKGETLKAILGSCVGIGVIWKEKKRCALAHCFLPESASAKGLAVDEPHKSARFVDQTITALFHMLKVKDEDRKNLEIVIAGGAYVSKIKALVPQNHIGDKNITATFVELKKHGLEAFHKDVGGESGRKIFIDASNFTYKIETIPSHTPSSEVL